MRATSKRNLIWAVGLVVVGLSVGLAIRQSAEDSPASSARPVQAIEFYEIHSDTVEDLTRRADIVFVGVVSGYAPGVYVESPDAEDPSEVSTVFDGVVFTPIEVLKGDVPAEVIIATPVELRGNDIVPTARIEQPPIQIVRPGIDAIGAADQQTYLVFASPMPDDPKVYAFYGSGGITQILPNGKLAPGMAPPFIERSDGRPSVVSKDWDGVRQDILEAILLG